MYKRKSRDPRLGHHLRNEPCDECHHFDCTRLIPDITPTPVPRRPARGMAPASPLPHPEREFAAICSLESVAAEAE